ncbi:N-acetylmuramoyl-L-alanine amidase [Erysipelothrix sp. D19-032]
MKWSLFIQPQIPHLQLTKQANLANNEGTNSFNAVADANEVYETVRFSDVAHHAGDKDVNQRSIGVELVESNIEAKLHQLSEVPRICNGSVGPVSVHEDRKITR